METAATEPSGQTAPAPADAGLPAGFEYTAPRWLIGGHAQTVWAARVARLGAPLHYRRERWTTPDGDFIDVDRLAAAPRQRRLLVLFHGLEGSSASHYARAFARWSARHGWDYAVPHFRGCSGEPNRAPRSYHAGDFEEIGWILQRLRRAHQGALVAVGVSLGGNALLRWAEEAGESAAQSVSAVCSISAPLDLVAAGLAIGHGFNRQFYTRVFLRTMKPKALAKLAQFPGLFDLERLLAARDLYAFDDLYTAPLHGFRNTDDYWRRASAKPQLQRIRVPALLVNARDDPFVPAASLPVAGEVASCVTLWQPAHGGHVGFVGGAWPGHVRTLPIQVMRWAGRQL